MGTVQELFLVTFYRKRENKTLKRSSLIRGEDGKATSQDPLACLKHYYKE